MTSTEEWLHLYDELLKVHLQRNIDYFRLHNYYMGNYYDYMRPDIHDGAGRLILRDNRRTADARRPLVGNLLKGIVDDYVSLVGQLPDIKVPPPGTSQASQEFADHKEKFHHGVWYASKMVMQMKALAWWNSVMGGCGIVVWPDFEKKHATIRVVAPYCIYGVPDMRDPYRLSKAIVAEKFDYLAVKDEYPQAELKVILQSIDEKYYSYAQRERKVEVVKCFDKDEVVTIIGKKEVARARHDLNFVPVFQIQNIYIPGELRGHSDIEQAIGLNEHINFILNAYEEYVLQDIYSPIVVVDPQKVPEDIFPLSPNELIPVNAGGDVRRLPPGQGATAVDKALQRTQALIEHNTGDPQVRTEGRMRSSITTGRGIEKAQGPHFGRIEYRHDIIAFYLEMVNEAVLEMTNTLFEKDQFVLFGSRPGTGGSMFNIRMKGVDLQHYGYNDVLYSPSQTMGLAERAVFVLQLLGADEPLIDRRTAIEFLGIAPDSPGEMIKRIDEMLEKRIQRQVNMQKAASGPTGGGAEGPASPLEAQAALSSGSTPKGANVGGPAAEQGAGPAAAAGAGGGPGAAGQPAASGPEVMGGAAGASRGAPPTPPSFNLPKAPPDLPGPLSTGLEGTQPLIVQVERIISTMNVRGEVYAVGKFAQGEEGAEIEILTREFIDSRQIKRVLKRFFGAKVKVRSATTIPPDAVLITQGGGKGGSPQGQGPQAQQLQQ